MPNPETEGLAPDQYEVIGEKVTHRLAQRPGSYVVLKYVRPVIKRRDTQALACPPVPVGVIDGSRANVSVIAGVMTDKFLYHMPLYRQHKKMADAGIRVSPWPIQLMQASVALLEPIFDAQLESVRASRVKAMDKAGQTGTGKMKQAYFWPVYGERDEICFLHYPGRSGQHVRDVFKTRGRSAPQLSNDPKTRIVSKTMLPKRSKSSILTTQFEPLKSLVKVAPLRRKWVAP